MCYSFYNFEQRADLRYLRVTIFTTRVRENNIMNISLSSTCATKYSFEKVLQYDYNVHFKLHYTFMLNYINTDLYKAKHSSRNSMNHIYNNTCVLHGIQHCVFTKLM